MASKMLPAVADPQAAKASRTSGPRSKKVLTKKAASAAVTENGWAKFVGLVATGHIVSQALKAAKITNIALEGLIRTKPELRQEFEDAKITALRLHWDLETVEEILVQLALNTDGEGSKTLKQIVEDHGCAYEAFMRLVLKDPVIGEMYEEARTMQMEGMADQIIAISDSSGQDEIETESGHTKVNHEVIQRDRLRVDTRKWIMSKLHHKRFGDRIQQDIDMNVTVDHAGQLEDARRRKEALHKLRQGGVTVEQLDGAGSK
jgi:hypothetical protein